jgi:hypothetical protein
MRYTIPAGSPSKLSRCFCLLLFALLLELPLLSQEVSRGSISPASSAPSESFTRVLANQKKSEISLDEFERIERIEKRKAASDSTPWNTTVLRLFPAGPGTGKIVLTVDGQPTEAAILHNELEKLAKYLDWTMQEGPAQREAYAKAERKRKERFELMDATHQAFLFTFEGQEQRDDRTLLRYSMLPNPDYRPTTRNTIVFTRVRGTIWIDERSSQLAKIDGSVTEDISIALFLAKVYKGSHFMQERYEVVPGVWEPTFDQYDFDGRKFMVPFSIHERTFYTNYRHIGPPKEGLKVIRAELSKLPLDQRSQ